MKHYPLIVAGGGLTGVAAAIAAARSGMEVLLIEQGNALGGAAVHNLVNPFMPYWTKVDKNPDLLTDGTRNLLSCGIFGTIVEELQKAGATDKFGMTIDEEYLKLLLNRMVLQHGVTPLFHTQVMDASTENGHITSVTVFSKGGQETLTADYFIDATGDADLAYLCGVPCEQGREKDGFCQPMTLCFRVANVDAARFKTVTNQKLNEIYHQYQSEGKTRNPREDVLYFHTVSPSVIHFNTTRVVKRNPLDAWDLTAAEIEAREQVYEMFTMLKKEIDGFEEAVLVSTAARIGVRDSRRIRGQHVLTAEEVLSCHVFDDSIAVGNYSIDIHNPTGTGTVLKRVPVGKYYTIPLRSLIPAYGADNLLVAGRCLSATHEAQSSTRVMPICCCLGEAAGEAVVVAARHGCCVPDVPYKEVQDRLVAHGARIR